MDNRERNLYGKFRGLWRAIESLRAAKIVAQFERHEHVGDSPVVGDVCITCEQDPDPDLTSDVPGVAEALRKAHNEWGTHIVSSQFWDGREWKTADSIGNCTGYVDPTDPFENVYVVDLMESAINQSPIPDVEQLARDIQDFSIALERDGFDELPEPFADVRLRYYKGTWSLLTGDPSFDSDHRGFWGSGLVGTDETINSARSIALGLIEEVNEEIATSLDTE